MGKDDIEFRESFEQSGMSVSSTPIEPGGHYSHQEDDSTEWALKPNRSGTIFVFGLLSLLCCWPLGLVAYFMGRSDLAGIRSGRLSADGSGLIKVGMTLGVLGVLMIIISAVAAVFYAPKIPDQFPRLEEMFKREPLPANQLSYVGAWRGDDGTRIIIRRNGTGDFKTEHSKVTGGKVKIEGDTLSIGFMGITKTWRIEKPPKFDDGMWIMKLDEETFSRKAEESIARLGQYPSVGGCGRQPSIVISETISSNVPSRFG